MSDPLMTIDDIAVLLHVSKSTVERWIRTNDIPSIKAHNVRRFIPSIIQKWMDAGCPTANEREASRIENTTGMKPILERLPDDQARHEFEKELLGEYQKIYPLQNDGNILAPMRRLFIVAVK